MTNEDWNVLIFKQIYNNDNMWWFNFIYYSNRKKASCQVTDTIGVICLMKVGVIKLYDGNILDIEFDKWKFINLKKLDKVHNALIRKECISDMLIHCSPIDYYISLCYIMKLELKVRLCNLILIRLMIESH